MDDTQDQARCDFPISGDIIFVVSTNGAHPVMAYQTALSRPRPELVHVATVLTPVDVLEANIGKRTLIIPTAKRAITLPPREWSEARGKNQKYRILRRTDISLQSKQERMIEAGSRTSTVRGRFWTVGLSPGRCFQWDRRRRHGASSKFCRHTLGHVSILIAGD